MTIINIKRTHLEPIGRVLVHFPSGDEDFSRVQKGGFPMADNYKEKSIGAHRESTSALLCLRILSSILKTIRMIFTLSRKDKLKNYQIEILAGFDLNT